MNAPYIIIPLLIVVAVAVWWFRGRISESTISGLREQLNVFDARVRLAAEKAEFAEHAKDEFERQVNNLRVEAKAGNGAIIAKFEKLEAAFEKFVVANNAVRSAIGVITGISTVGTPTIRLDEGRK